MWTLGARSVITDSVSAGAAHCLTFCCCAVSTSVLRLMALSFVVFFFNLVLFFLPGRMSSLCTPRTLDVIFSTWSLRYLLSSTELPSHCSATWNAWLASSLEPSWNCVLKRHQLLHLSPSSSRVCRSQREDSCTAAQSAGKHPSSGCISVPQGWLRLFKLSFNIYFTYYKQKVHHTFPNTLLMSCVRALPCLLQLSAGGLQPTDSIRVFRINKLHHQEIIRDESSCCFQRRWLPDTINTTGKIFPLKQLPGCGHLRFRAGTFCTHPTQRPTLCALNLDFNVIIECMFVGVHYRDSFNMMKWLDGFLMMLKTENVWLPNVIQTQIIHFVPCVFSTTQKRKLTLTLKKQTKKQQQNTYSDYFAWSPLSYHQ